MAEHPRDPESQLTHDDVIEALRRHLTINSGGRRIETNPGKARNFGFAGSYPDLCMLDELGEVAAIYEVETEDSIHDGEISQWVSFAKLANRSDVKFVLACPQEEEVIASLLTLLAQYEIQVAEIIGYEAHSSSVAFFDRQAEPAP